MWKYLEFLALHFPASSLLMLWVKTFQAFLENGPVLINVKLESNTLASCVLFAQIYLYNVSSPESDDIKPL